MNYNSPVTKASKESSGLQDAAEIPKSTEPTTSGYKYEQIFRTWDYALTIGLSLSSGIVTISPPWRIVHKERESGRILSDRTSLARGVNVGSIVEVNNAT